LLFFKFYFLKLFLYFYIFTLVIVNLIFINSISLLFCIFNIIFSILYIRFFYSLFYIQLKIYVISFFAPKVLSSLGLKYSTEQIYVRNDDGADSEIVNVSARQAALNRWMVTDKRWNKKVVSHGSVVASVKRLPFCARNSWALTLMGPSVSRATGKKSWVPLRELYFVVFLTAAVSVALALVMALCWR